MDLNSLDELFKQGKISESTYNMAKPAQDFTPTPAVMPAPAPALVPPAQPVAQQPLPAPLPEPIPAPAPVAPVTQEIEMGSERTTTTTSKVKSPLELKAEKDLTKSFELQKKANESIAATAQVKAAEEFNLRQEQDKINSAAMAKRQEAADKGNAEYEARLAKIDADVEAMKSQEYQGFWAKKDTGSKIVGALAVAMGAYASATGAGPNYALNIIQKAADDDFDHYKQNIAQQISAIEQSRLSLTNKEKLTEAKLAQLDAYSLAQNEQIKNKITALGSKFAGQDAQNKLMELNAKLDENLAEKRMLIEDKYAQSVTETVKRDIQKIQVDPKTGQVIMDSRAAAKQFDMLPKDVQKQVESLAEANAKTLASSSKISQGLAQLKNPKLDRDDKIRVGQAMLEDLVATGAVQKEEAERYGAELEGNWGKIGKAAGLGAGALGGTGAAVGSALGLPVGGIGAVPGGMIGGAVGSAVGLIGGAITGAIDAANDPGGIRFRGDPEGFAKRVELILEKNRIAVEMNERINNNLKRGMGATEARQKAELETFKQVKGLK